jgi:two-component sensor histidine kinase
MSAIQDRLHMSQDFTEIDIKEYVVDLLSNLKNSYSLKNDIQLLIDIDDLKLDLTKAVPFGLIINEIATNSFKYAFTENNLNPRLSIRCSCNDDVVKFEIEDNGPGMVHSKYKSSGMGLELVENLCIQIDGKMTHSLENGMKFSLEFSNKI